MFDEMQEAENTDWLKMEAGCKAGLWRKWLDSSREKLQWSFTLIESGKRIAGSEALEKETVRLRAGLHGGWGWVDAVSVTVCVCYCVCCVPSPCHPHCYRWWR